MPLGLPPASRETQSARHVQIVDSRSHRCASTQYIWNTRFATSNPYVVTFISGPPFLEWLYRNSTLAHRCLRFWRAFDRLPSPSSPEGGRCPFHLGQQRSYSQVAECGRSTVLSTLERSSVRCKNGRL